MNHYSPLRNIYNGLITVGESLQSLLLLAIRLYWGSGFFMSGRGKFNDIESVASYFKSLEIPMADYAAYTVASTELVGGLLLLIGFATRLVSIPLFCVMIGAYLTAHVESVKHILDDPSTFVKEAPFNFMLACLILFVFGPGKISLDYLLEKMLGNKDKSL